MAWAVTVPSAAFGVMAAAAILAGGAAVGRSAEARFAVLVLAVAAGASMLGVRAWNGLVAPDAGQWSGEATLVSDPVAVPGGVRVRLRLPPQAAQDVSSVVDARAWGGAGGQLRSRLMGEKIIVTGSVRPVDELEPWLAARRITARMTVQKVGSWRTGSVFTRIANSMRRTIESGASSISRDRRALLTGLVYGDDRNQSAVTADDFTAAGLTHLLAVSGQNVAFVLVLAGPLLRSFGFRMRFLLTLVIVFGFATLTRFEPSVMRASFMTGVAAFAIVLGRPATSLRVLGLAIAALVLWDPLIVHAVAFQLSVAASLGILVISPRLVPVIRGPQMFAEALAVTAGAQLGVAPLLIFFFGSVPVASLPANLLAGPMAGPAMMWGLTAGWLAGLMPAAVATWFHLPTRLMLAWIAGVARTSSVALLGDLTAWYLLVLAALLAFVLWRPTRRRRRWVGLGVALVLIAPVLVLSPTSIGSVSLDDGSTLWQTQSRVLVVLDQSSDAEDLLAGLRDQRVRRIDLVVVRRGGRRAFGALESLRERFVVTEVWAPQDHALNGVTAIGHAHVLDLGELTLMVEPIVDDSVGHMLIVTALQGG